MKNSFTLLLGLFVCLTGTGQSLERELIASSGNYFSTTNLSLEWSEGETSIQTFSNAGNILTQGFHQTRLTITALEHPNLESGLSDYQIHVFPNPVNDQVFVEVNGGINPVRTQITDMSGKLLDSMDEMEMGQRYSFPMNQLADGMYFVRLFDAMDKPIKTFKVIKAN